MNLRAYDDRLSRLEQSTRPGRVDLSRLSEEQLLRLRELAVKYEAGGCVDEALTPDERMEAASIMALAEEEDPPIT